MFAARVEHELAESKQREVPSTVVGDHVMSFLRRVDKIAYVRYASVYREFEDIDSLMREVESLVADGPDGAPQ
jgi:transcriptional repressor NrdR